MYPRVNSEFVGETFLCKLLHVENDGTLHLRPKQMSEAYRALTHGLQRVYVEQVPEPRHLRLAISDLYRTSQCVVVRNGYAVRGEIMNYDSEDGYSDVLFVDTGDRDFVELQHLHRPVPITSVIPALEITATLNGVSDYSHEVAEIIREVCENRGDIMGIVRSWSPSISVCLLTNALIDVGEYVRECIGATVGEEQEGEEAW